jgi:hypothetical protein
MVLCSYGAVDDRNRKKVLPQPGTEMMKKQRKSIPDFQTYEDAARFFDTTDTTTLEFDSESWQVFSTAKSRRGMKTVHVPVEIDTAQFRRLANRAKKQGTTPGKWLHKLIDEALKVKRVV